MLLKRIGRKMLVKIRPNLWRKRRIKRFGTLVDIMRHYCDNTTLHGLGYIADPELHAIERLFWLVIFALSACVASNVIYTLSRRYQAAPTSIGIESTNYKISEIPFPSVTLCPSDRVDWTKTPDVEKRIFSNSTDEETVKTFREILTTLSTVTFGDFDDLSFMKERKLDNLDHEIDGVVIMMSEPRVWPNSGSMIPAGSLVSVSLNCVSGFATQPVLELDEKRIPCRQMKSMVYNQETCLSLCKRAYVYKYCGCNPSFLFPSSSQRDCSIKDFLCLIDYNDLFNDYHVLEDEDVENNKDSMLCDCPPECEYYIYDPQFSTVPIYDSQDIILDVHFAGQTSFRYKTDIVITDLNLIVSFGGIIGLFLGGSLLSAAELIYYLMLALFYYLRPRRVSTRKEVRVVKTMIPSTSTISPLPILDYSPIKPRSKKIPILVNYDYVKSNPCKY